MSGPPAKSDGRIAFKTTCAAIVVVFVPMLYGLSMGPMLWLSTHDYLPGPVRQFLSRFYEPLWIVASYVPLLKQFLHWYISFWDR
jgi:hypothetical protein